MPMVSISPLLTTDANHARGWRSLPGCGGLSGVLWASTALWEIYDDATSRSIVINGQAQQLCPGMFDWNWASSPA